MTTNKITFLMRDPTNQLEPSTCKISATESFTVKKALQNYSVQSCAVFEHLRVQFRNSPVSITKADGALCTIGDLKLKDRDVLEISHRHGKVCRFCKRTIKIKLKAESGYCCSYVIPKFIGLKVIIEGFAKNSLTTIENLKLKYLGKEFKLLKPNGDSTTPADLMMGDGDQIDILHQRS